MSEQHTHDDIELMRHIERQDQTAFTRLYERYGKMIYGLTYRVLQNTQLAEEATQDTFLKVWRQASAWDPNKGRLSSWLLTIAHRTAIDRLRKEQRQTAPQTAALDEIAPPESDIGIPDDPLLRDGQHLRNLLQQIPTEQADLIEKAFLQGLTHRELAEKLDLPLGTVKTRVRLGLQKLKQLWTETTREANPGEDY